LVRSYHDEQKLQLSQKIRDICKDMPVWFIDFIRAQAEVLEPRTRFNYCIDARIFFNYLIHEHKLFYGYQMFQITPTLLSKLSLRDLEIYIEYLTYYVKVETVDSDDVPSSPIPAQKEIIREDAFTETEYENGEHGKARKIASLRSMFKYLYRAELITSNPAELLTTPKIHERSITRLTPEEVQRLLAAVEAGEGLSNRQKSYQRKTLKRDLAMLTLFLTSGIRVSDLVGLNIEDVHFESYSFRVIRKGGNENILYFGEETANALKTYIEERQNTGTYEKNSPLFLSMQNKRITVRAVENLVEKYAKIAVPLKKITPHKLRSTYGTMLYQNTGDIYLVADVLGHKDVNTTRRHYAAMSEENRKMAAHAVKLRED